MCTKEGRERERESLNTSALSASCQSSVLCCSRLILTWDSLLLLQKIIFSHKSNSSSEDNFFFLITLATSDTERNHLCCLTQSRRFCAFETVLPGNFPWVTHYPGKFPQVTRYPGKSPQVTLFYHKLCLLSMDTPLNSRRSLLAYRHIIPIIPLSQGCTVSITRQVLDFFHGQLIPSTARPSAFPYFRHLLLLKNKAFWCCDTGKHKWEVTSWLHRQQLKPHTKEETEIKQA